MNESIERDESSNFIHKHSCNRILPSIAFNIAFEIKESFVWACKCPECRSTGRQLSFWSVGGHLETFCVCSPFPPSSATLPLHSHPPSTAQQMQMRLISFVSNSDIFNPFSPNSNWEKLTWNVVDGFFEGSRKKEYTVVFCLNPHFVFWRSANVTYVPSRVYVPLEWEFCVSDLKTCPRGW